MSDAIKPALSSLAQGQAPSDEQLATAFAAILDGQATPAQIGAFLMGLEQVGVTGPMIAAGARALRSNMLGVAFDGPTMDVCGTGGDGSHTLSISTAVSFVLAGCGVTVAKHGNRAMSSRSGAADVLEALGVNLAMDGRTHVRALQEARISFFFAQAHHPAMRHVAGPRRELGVRTIFNLLGPLSNPAGAQRQLLGVFSADKVIPVAEALKALGATKAWVVHGDGGLDEVALSGPTQVAALKNGAISTFTVTPEEAGLAPSPLHAIQGGDAEFNAAALMALLEGAEGPYQDMVCLNAAAALIVAGIAADLKEGVVIARACLQAGKAKSALERLIAVSQGSAS
jgi:anthranilate phosphoribosyltransferase